MLLAIDSSTQNVGLALFDGYQVVGELVWASQNHHTVEIAPAIEYLLSRCGVKRNTLTGIGVALGPGSFTSLRIGLAIAKGIALSLHLPMVGVPTHDILATAQPQLNLPLGALIKAGRGRIAVRWYENRRGSWKSDDDAIVMTIEELSGKIQKPTYLCGEISGEDRQVLAKNKKNFVFADPANTVRRPANLAVLSWNKLKRGDQDDVVRLSPIYLHIANPIPDV